MLLLSACASGTESPADGTGDTATSPGATSTSVAVPVETDDSPVAIDASGSAPSSTVPDSTSPAVLPEGFDATQAVVTKADGTTCEICVWRAETAQLRSRGLMFVTDLGVADGMAFRYPDPHTGTFWMKNTLLPLSIAFFAPGGEFISSFDMEPCTTPSCPNYATPTDFLVAVEVPQGALEELGIVEGSRLRLVDLPCAG